MPVENLEGTGYLSWVVLGVGVGLGPLLLSLSRGSLWEYAETDRQVRLQGSWSSSSFLQPSFTVLLISRG